MARNGVRVGIALGSHQATALILGRKTSSCPSVSIDLDVDGSDLRQEIRVAVGRLKAALDRTSGEATDDAVAHVTLLPPLADARLLPFPPLRTSEVEAVLKRDVARHFLGANRPQVVGVRMPEAKKKPGTVGSDGSIAVLAAAAPMALLEMIREVLAEVGWRGASFSAAHSAWLKAALQNQDGSVGAIVAVVGATAHVLRLSGSDPSSVRKLPVDDVSVVAESLSGSHGKVLLLADPQVYQVYTTHLARQGLAAIHDSQGWNTAGESAAARAAAVELELVSPSLAAERKERGKRTATSLLVGAGILFLASLGIQLWGAQRELGAVQGERAAIRPEVVPLLSARDSLATLTTQVASMDSLARNTPVWTRFLVELSALLPEDAHLTGLFASGDTVELEAAGSRAGEAIQSLREAGLFEEVRLQGLVEREMEEGETVVERFRLWGRVPETPGEEVVR